MVKKIFIFEKVVLVWKNVFTCFLWKNPNFKNVFIFFFLNGSPEHFTVESFSTIQSAKSDEHSAFGSQDSRSLQNYTRLYLQLIDKELHRPEIDISRIVSYLNTMLERSSLTLDQKLLIVTRKLELLEEYGDDIVV